jgi:Zn-dependent oligopeptidase
MTTNIYSKEIHDNIVSVNKLILDINKDKYNLLLSFINELLKPEKIYSKITQFKNINQSLLEPTNDNLQIINDYFNKFTQIGCKLNNKNKNPIYIIKHVSNKLGYSFTKKIYLDNTTYYTILYKR